MKTKKIHNIFYTILLSLSTLSNASTYNDKPFKPPGRFINIGFQTMYVDCLGENKPTIIVDVGIAASSASWYKIAKELSKNTEVLKYFDINKKSIILIAISFFAIQKLFFISQYSINFPYSVDHIVFGYFIDYLVDGGSFTHYLFSTHSEHYLIFPRLIMLPNLILNN